MDEKLIPVKTETHLINCYGCNAQIRFVTQTMGDQKYHVFEFQHKMIKKFENRENLYLRDTSEKLQREYPYYNEIIRVMYFNSLLNCYVMSAPNTSQPKEVSKEFIFNLIRGKYRNEGLELVDIYGHIKK